MMPQDDALRTHLAALQLGPVLALDTSTPLASLCLSGMPQPDALDEQTLATVGMPSEALSVAMAQLFGRHALPATKLAAIVVGIGPGSFTGLRVGLATVKGIAMGAGVALYGISTLALMAASGGKQGRVALLNDARRGEYFAACYDIGPFGAATLVIADQVTTVEAFAAQLREARPDHLLGDRARLLAEAIGFAEPVQDLLPQPRAAYGIVQAASRIAAKQADSLATLTPRYLRIAEAERALLQSQTPP